ncbi:hypothetical protein SAMN05421788_107206 [Filimonas lacunae]|uniref:Calcineurin-like phosphoesterase domain-containing protein n=1 Tax=Filimonas lacunae TaxID=477680 RepID=A0A173MGI3_9BACT|nr:metallophosphoesterase [Filimonas lacunae]BAV06541.1 phosphoesterase [Filimonas lacunae]SIT27324.1 hypothetical protein SAMN05421788_107206 [Filimonas lacunae]
MINRLVIITVIWFAIDFYFLQSLVTISANWSLPARESVICGFWLADFIIVALILYGALSPRIDFSASPKVKWLVGLVILSIVPKLLALPVLLVEDITRIISIMISWVHDAPVAIPRNKQVSELAVIVAVIPFTAIIYGMWHGKYRYQVHKIILEFDNLPEAFEGFSLTHLSDIHSGSLINAAKVLKGIELTNAQQSDLIVFTGDIVNNKASEMVPWISTFSRLSAPMGKFSVLGNHDYGDYIQWPDAAAKAANLAQLKQIHEQIGFRLLLNEHITLQKNGQSITVAGVENWGKGGFAKHGDLKRAMAGVPEDAFTILLSHDPSHWEIEVMKYPKLINLTLSGHTHGMQFGIELFGFKWSPIKYMYKQWAGAYHRDKHTLYVNRGFGFLGFPGRVGIHPEITVITLQKKR